MVCRQGRPGIKAKPAKPKHARTQQYKRNICGYIFKVFTFTQNQNTCNGSKPGTHVHNSTSGKILHAKVSTQQPVRMPNHVAQWGIYKNTKQANKQKKRYKTDTLCQRPCNDGRGYYGKFHLEKSKQYKRNG